MLLPPVAGSGREMSFTPHSGVQAVNCVSSNTYATFLLESSAFAALAAIPNVSVINAQALTANASDTLEMIGILRVVFLMGC
jgi:hypothetical protein